MAKSLHYASLASIAHCDVVCVEHVQANTSQDMVFLPLHLLDLTRRPVETIKSKKNMKIT
jgi:hypothetical protein